MTGPMSTAGLPWLLLQPLIQVMLRQCVAAFAIGAYSHCGAVPKEILMMRPPGSTMLYAAGLNGDNQSSSSRRRKLVDRSNYFSSVVDDASSRTETKTKPQVFEDNQQQEEEELCFLDELPGTNAGQSCFVSSASAGANDGDNNPSPSSSLPFNTRIPPMETMELALKYLPFIMPIVAYFTYEPTAKVFNLMVQFLSSNNWIAVDGGQYQAVIITPAINGLVVPSLALLFATLMNNTINTLRQRQLQIRTSLNTEANDLRMLATVLDSLPPELVKAKNHLREYLIQYASRVIAESKPGLSIENHMYIGSMDIELNGFLRMWNGLSMSTYGTIVIETMLPAASNYTTLDQAKFDPYQNQLGISSRERQNFVPFLSPYIFTETYDALTRLRKERSIRVSALQSTYPMLHYAILALLAGSICAVFLMETNQDLLLFLSAIQLKVLWSMLIGTFSALVCIEVDMIDPFRGSYNVAVSVDQFYTIRATLMASIEEVEKVKQNNKDSSANL